MYVPAWLDRKWRREYAAQRTASVASPNNGWAVAIYGMQAVLGIGHISGRTAPESFGIVFGETLLLPWGLTYLVCGFLGAYAVVFLRRIEGTRMRWARPEFVATVGLVVANGMYAAALILGYTGERFPYITFLAIGALLAGALFRSSQIGFERVKARRFTGYAKE